MNDTIERIKTIEAQIEWIERALKQGEHVGAGLTLIVNVGPEPDDSGDEASLWNRDGSPKQIACEVSYDTEDLLGLMKHSLGKSLHQNKASLRREHAAATEVLRRLDEA